MIRKFYKLIFLVAFSLSLFTNSCDVLEGLNLFTLEDDVQLGYDVDMQIRNNPGEYPIYRADPTVKSYIQQRIFNHILSSAKVEHKNVFPYQIEIIDDPNVLNAFCVPGGFIYLYTGLLLYLDSEAALAGVVGHEIAHAELRHTTQRLTAYYGTSILLGIILGENPAILAEIAANLFVGLAFLANSRYDEDRSDEFSFEYLKDTRYYPGGVKFFFEKLQFDGYVGNNSSVEVFLSTHPDPIERIANTNQRLIDNGYDVENFQSNAAGIFRNDYFIYIRNKL